MMSSETLLVEKLEKPMSDQSFLNDASIERPIICGAMYPCSNPELVAAASEAGGIGIIQPLSLVYVHGHDFREGLKLMKSMTSKPLGMNVIVEKSSKVYEDRMKLWVDVAIEEGVKFFVTSLGNPRWVVEKAAKAGGHVYHDVTTKQWAEKAVSEGVSGLICVNNRAGGHAGTETIEKLIKDMSSFNIPIIAAGGISSAEEVKYALDLGYQGVQLGTRFIATKECSAHQDYKEAIVRAKEEDIVLTEKISGVPVAVIKTEFINKVGTKASPIAKFLLKGRKTKHYMRLFYTLKSLFQLSKANKQGSSYKDYFQAGKSVKNIQEVKSTKEVMDDLAKLL
jgi:nitronate monooxygenase